MDFQYEIKNKALKKLVQNKSLEEHISVGNLIWGYINRGLLSDSIGEDVFYHNHSEEFLNEVNKTLGIGK